MKSINKYLAIFAILAFSSIYFPVQADEINIGIVNTSRVVQMSPQGKKVLEELQKEFSDRKQKLVAEEKELKEKQQKMEKDSVIMSQAEVEDLQSQIRLQQHELKRDRETFQEDLQYERKQKLTKINKLVIQAIRTVAKMDGYDLVMGQTVAYASNQVNITDKVIEYLRKKAG